MSTVTFTGTDRVTGKSAAVAGSYRVLQPMQPMPGRVLFGAYPGPGNAGPQALEQIAGRKLGPVTRYVALDDGSPSAADLALAAQGQLFRFAWSSRLVAGGYATWASVAAGAHDAAIEAHAKLLAKLGPVLIGYDTEVDGAVSIGRSGPAASYPAAYERLHQIASPLLPDAVWCVNWTGDLANKSEMLATWPAAVPLSWVFADPYDATLSKGTPMATYEPWAEWFAAQPFAPGLATGIGETGVQPAPTTGSARDAAGAAWILAVPAAVKECGYASWQWFNSSGGLGNTGLAVGSLMAAAFKTIGADPVFSTT